MQTKMYTTKLIRITDNKIFLTTENSFKLSQTSLKGKDLIFRTVQDIYLKVEIIGYDQNTKGLNLNVTDYEPKDTSSFKEQSAKAEVSFIFFKPLKWSEIEKHLSVYTKARLIDDNIIIDDVTPNENYITKNPFSGVRMTDGLDYLGIERSAGQITEEAKIYFKDADFNKGFVVFSYKSKELAQTYNLKIENPHLLPEFNAIKEYFPKVFKGNKKFSITVVFTIGARGASEIHTASPEIESINEDIIDKIKRERIANLTSTPLLKLTNRSIFTADDIFDSFDENLKSGNIFNQSEEDILHFLIENKNIRNATHLQFLSGSKHSPKQKLRFSLKPLFGFVFFIEGSIKNHFCWELLNSHATYIWSFDKNENDTPLQFQKVEEIINVINGIGRENYKKEFKNNKDDKDFSFWTIDHSNVNAASKEGFAEWKDKLLEGLV